MLADICTVEWAPSDTPYDTSPTWVDITNHVTSINARQGTPNLDEPYGAGSARFEVNNGGVHVSPWLSQSTWFRWRQIRFSAVGYGVVWAGYVTRVEHDTNRANAWTATIEATDALGILAFGSTDADFATYAGGSPIGEVTERTIGNTAGYVTDGGLADVATWLFGGATSLSVVPQHWARVPVFVETKQAGNPLQLLGDYLDAELGTINCIETTVYVEGRYERFQFISAVDYTLADNGTGYKMLAGSLKFSAPDDSYIDDATVGGQGIDNQHTTATPAGYPPSGYSRTSQSPLADANWAQANADMVVALGKQTDVYPKSVSVHVAGPKATTLDTGHPGLAGVNFRFNIVNLGVTYRLLTKYVEYDIDPDFGWKTTFGFTSVDRIANAYGSAGIFKIGVSAWGGSEILGP